MHSSFEAEKNQKALIYTVLIYAVLFLIFFFITWPVNTIAPPPPIQDLIEVNLGNEFEGMGEEQPLVKGEPAPAQDPVPQQQTTAANDEPAKDIETDDDKNDDAAPVTKVEKNNSKKIDIPKETVKKTIKVNNPAPVPTPAPKPRTPKITMPGGRNGGGNNANEDNGFNQQGKKPGGGGDDGFRNGDPNSNGSNHGGLKIKGDRKIVNHYIFVGDLPKATINAVIKVSPDGRGTFIKIDPRGSTSTESKYANDIRNKLPNIQFNTTDHESTITVTFIFKQE